MVAYVTEVNVLTTPVRAYTRMTLVLNRVSPFTLIDAIIRWSLSKYMLPSIATCCFYMKSYVLVRNSKKKTFDTTIAVWDGDCVRGAPIWLDRKCVEWRKMTQWEGIGAKHKRRIIICHHRNYINESTPYNFNNSILENVNAITCISHTLIDHQFSLTY